MQSFKEGIENLHMDKCFNINIYSPFELVRYKAQLFK